MVSSLSSPPAAQGYDRCSCEDGVDDDDNAEALFSDMDRGRFCGDGAPLLRRPSSLRRVAVVTAGVGCFALIVLSARFSSRPSSSAQGNVSAQLSGVMSKFKLDLMESSMSAFVDEFGGGDPFEWKCPLPSMARHLSANWSNSTVDGSAVGANGREIDACCRAYDESGWPYQFPQCASNHSKCPSCWASTTPNKVVSRPLTNLAAVAWAASTAVSSKAQVKKEGIGAMLMNWMEDGIAGEDTEGLAHAELKTHSIQASLGTGLQKADRNLCPQLSDWEEYMLNDETDNIHARIYKSKSKRLAIVVFRGTQMASMKNWHVDADILRVPMQLGENGPTARVHEGFYTALQRVLPRLRKWVEGYVAGLFGSVPATWTLVFAGHSLGGALALLATSVAESQGWDRKPDATITFGSPRVANAVLSKWWQERGLCQKLLRVNVYNDVIHWMPSKKIEGLAYAASKVADCVHDLSTCLFGSSSAGGEDVDEEGWAHVCHESELVVPGSMKGINPEESDISPFGGALSHFLGNCLYGYGFGALHSVIMTSDQYCGISPAMCPIVPANAAR